MPSAHAFIASRGREDRGIEVVQVQCGRPKNTTTAQKARITRRRVDIRPFDSDSTEYDFASSGGSVFASMMSSDVSKRTKTEYVDACRRVHTSVGGEEGAALANARRKDRPYGETRLRVASSHFVLFTSMNKVTRHTNGMTCISLFARYLSACTAYPVSHRRPG